MASTLTEDGNLREVGHPGIAQGGKDAVFVIQTSGSVKQATVTKEKLASKALARNIF
jgi:hypothetical protein